MPNRTDVFLARVLVEVQATIDVSGSLQYEGIGGDNLSVAFTFIAGKGPGAEAFHALWFTTQDKRIAAGGVIVPEENAGETGFTMVDNDIASEEADSSPSVSLLPSSVQFSPSVPGSESAVSRNGEVTFNLPDPDETTDIYALLGIQQDALGT